MRRPRLVLVHGSVANAEATWRAQEPLAEEFELVVPNRRGFPPGPEVAAVDFEDEADWLLERIGAGAHVVGHSYGGVIALLAAARRPSALRSLTVIEPPAFGVARGAAAADAIVEAQRALWARHEALDERRFLQEFLALIGGGSSVPDPLPPDLAQGTRLLKRERPPGEAQIPFAPLRAAALPVLVVSSGVTRALETVCDTLARELAAERVVIPGTRHAVQFVGQPFNELLAAFVRRVEAGAAGGRS
jgi:pimeloyl-ACP methyl ester carboxylesterase